LKTTKSRYGHLLQNPLQDRVDRARPGAELALPAGVWEGNLQIDKKITLRGHGTHSSFINGMGSYQSTLIVGPSDVTVQLSRLSLGRPSDRAVGPNGLTVIGQGKVSAKDAKFLGQDWAVALWDEGEVQLRRCKLSADEYGLVLLGLARAKVQNCSLIKNGQGCGLLSFDSTQADVSVSTISENKNGIVAWDSSKIYLGRSQIRENRDYGIVYYLSSLGVHASLNGHDNEFRRNGKGKVKFVKEGGNRFRDKLTRKLANRIGTF